ncbi:MAG: hypothetical protein PUP93_15550 [Rhizonema sp. NSF051]|nr:hypothetical protein [Rhizonema sp. NSF051]
MTTVVVSVCIGAVITIRKENFALLINGINFASRTRRTPLEKPQANRSKQSKQGSALALVARMTAEPALTATGALGSPQEKLLIAEWVSHK